MAKKRMFSQDIVLSDDFLDMPASTRCLYFCLGMLADDDGFVNNPKSVMRQCGSTVDDFQLLLTKGYIYLFESGVIVILHWKINNYLRPDRYTPTKYVDEKALLSASENGVYILGDGIPLGIPADTRTGYPDKIRLDKYSIERGADKPPRSRFMPPTVEEVKAYCAEQGYNIDAESFVSFYESKGWMIGKSPMKSWKHAVITWKNRGKPEEIKKEYADVI